MGSRELGLVLGQQILGVDDLHYGLWGADLEVKFSNLATAQQRYTDKIIASLPSLDKGPVKVLDIGCGTGHILAQMIDRGYQVDGVIPAANLARIVRQRIAERNNKTSQVFECKLEEFPADRFQGHYDVALFSESFQYIEPSISLPIVSKILKPGGTLIISDFFKTTAHGDGAPGDGTFGGGHPWDKFQRVMADMPFHQELDQDITAQVSPNLALVNELLMHKILPVGQTLGRYMRDNYPRISWLGKKLFGKKFQRKVATKYFSGHRSQAVFERYKTYHFMIFRHSAQ